MDTSEYNKIKQEVLDIPIIYREMESKDIVALGDNFYNLGTTNVQVEPTIAEKIDQIAGIKARQARIAYDSYGDHGLTNLRNFFGQATKDNRILLTANAQAKQILDVVPIKGRVITPHSFFNFVEMYMDKNQYYPEKVEYTDGGSRVSVIMKPVNEQFMEYSKGDEFLSNGIFFTWNPTEISLGNYYVRLVCTNGSTTISRHSITRITSPDIEEFQRMLNITSRSDVLKKDTETMLDHTKIAMKTKASVNELKSAMLLLVQHGLDERDANDIIPYESTKRLYQSAGYPMDAKNWAQAKSDKTMWEVFNMLTFFATHNEVWSPHDIRRSSLMESCMALLLKKRDIQEYYNIF